MYISSSMLMALYEDRIRDHLARHEPQPGRARSPRTRSWATRARTVLRARCVAGAASAGAGAAGARP